MPPLISASSAAISAAAPPLLSEVTTFLTLLLPSTLSITTFKPRWHSLRSNLAVLKSLLHSISASPHHTSSPLLSSLLLSLLPTLRRLHSLCLLCSPPSPPTPSKLLMQSDLDIAISWLTKLNHDLDLLLRSGVLHHSTAIVLSHPEQNASKEVVAFFVRDVFTRLQIGGVELRRKALDSLLQLLREDEKAGVVVAKEGDVGCLVGLLDGSGDLGVREKVVGVVGVLAKAGEFSRKCVFEEGGLGPLLRIIETGSMGMKETAAMAVECITSDSDHAWGVSAYSGVPILVELCKSGSVLAQAYAVGAIRNVSTVEDMRVAFCDEGAVPVLVELLVSGNGSVQEKAASCIAILASSGEFFRELVLGEKGLQRLLQCLGESSSSATLEHVLRAIYSLSASESAFRVLSSSGTFVVQIADLLKHGNVMLQHISASLLAKLSIGGVNKRAISGCMGSLVKLMESAKPDGLQEMATNALVSLLTVKPNRKDLVKDEKSLIRLVQMLDPGNDLVSKKFPIAVVAAIMAGGSQSCRKRLLAAGAHGHLQRLSEMEVSGAKKAMQKLSVNRIKNIFTMTWRE